MVARGRQVPAAGLPPLRCRLAPPALPVPHVPRPRLWELLEAGDRALTIVRGPAGCGKTALLASWYLARRDGLPLVWLQVDPATGPAPAPASAIAAPVRVSFWAHLLAALRSHPDADPTGALARLSPPAPGGRADLFCRELTDALAIGRPLPLVAILDDVGLIQDPADIAGLELLAQGARGLRLVLSGRRIPVAAHRARAAGQLTDIGPDLLAFDPAETDRLLAALRVPAAAATGLRAATEGWAAGLRLAAAALTTAADVAAVAVAAGGVASARAQDGTSVARGPVGECANEAAGRPALPPAAFAPVADYLRAEALATMPAGLRRLLVLTSVLDEVCGPLAEAVAAEPAAGDRLLAELATGAVLATPLLGSPLATPLPAGRPGAADGGLTVDRGLGGGLGIEANPGLGGDWGLGSRLSQAPGPRQETDARGAGGTDDPAGGGAAPGDGQPHAAAVAPASWYRYHALLRGVLRDTLRRDPAEDEAELNLRAALWYAANRRLVDAARHAREAADWRYLACLVARGTVPLLLQGELRDLAALVGDFPDRAAGLGPECAITAAAARVLAGDAVIAGEYLELARSGLAAATSAAGQPGAAARLGQRGTQAATGGAGSPGAARRVLLTAIEAVELRRAELTGDVDAALATARRVLRVRATAEPGPAAGLPDGLRPLALAARGRAELWRGRLEAAQDALGVALADARSAGFTGATAGCLGALALGFALRGRLRQAEETAAAALAAGRPRELTWLDGPARADATSSGAEQDDIARGRDPDGSSDLAVVGRPGAGREPVDRLVSLAAPAVAGVPGTAEALLALAVVAGHRGDSAVGLGWADLAGRAAGESGQLPGLVGLLRAWLRLGRRTGEDLRAARRALAAFPAREAPALLAAVREATQADLLVAGGNPDAALRLLGPDETASRRDRPAARLARGRAHLARGDAAAAAVSVAPLLRADGGGSASVVGACAISAVAAARQGDGAQAGGLLARAFALAQDEQLVRPFVELGPEIVALIDAHPGLPDAAPRLVATLRQAVAREAQRRPNERPRTVEHVRPGEQGRSGQPRPASRGERAGTGPARGATRPQAGPHPVTVPTARRASRPVGAHPDAALGQDGPAPWEAGEEARGAGPRRAGASAWETRGGFAAGRPGPAGRAGPGGRPGAPPRGSSLAGGTVGGGSPMLGDGRVGDGHASGGPAATDGSAVVDGRDGVPRGPDDQEFGGQASRGSVPRDSRGPVPAAGRRPSEWLVGAAQAGFPPPDALPPGSERAARQPAGRGADRLSDRELAVLSYLPTMLTTAEIATELYVSVNTVKTHLKSIYRKLDVARRRDAVHRARALHLL